MDELTKKTKLESGLLLAIIIVVVLMLSLLIFGLSPINFFVCFLYPTLQTLKSLEESKSETDWLQFWTVFGIFTLLEELLYFVFNLIPFYGFFRLLFVIYLVNSRSQGAAVIYDLVVRPLVAESREKMGAKIVQINNPQNKTPTVTEQPKSVIKEGDGNT